MTATTHRLAIKDVAMETHNVRKFVVERPESYHFRPGQATEWTLLRDGFENEPRPFSFASTPDDPHLEFYVKTYTDRDGVTEEMLKLNVLDEIELGEPFGAIEYIGEGVFIAGGAGITPYISIFRTLADKAELSGNRLIYSCRKEEDIILRDELIDMLGDDCLITTTDQKSDDFAHGRVDRLMLRQEVEDFDQPFYICGPPSMVSDLSGELEDLGADSDNIVIEDGWG